MAFDGLVMANICKELKDSLVGGRISKITMPNKDELIFTIKNRAENFRLLISANASLPLIYLTDSNKTNPASAPAFCMFLRKHIGTAKIQDIYTRGLERIIILELEHRDELGDISSKKLIFEMMGKHSNIIFTDAAFRILDSIKRINASTSSIREVLPGRTYFLPEELQKTDPFCLTEEDFCKQLKASQDSLLRVLYLQYAGISPLVADELCIRAGLDAETPASSLSELALRHLYRTFELVLEDIRQGYFYPHIIYKGEEPVEFSCIPLSAYEGAFFSKKSYESISRLLQDYYSEKDMYLRIRQKSADLRKIIHSALERCNKKYDLQKKQLMDTDKMDAYRVYGDLITSYGYSLQGGEKEFYCENFYDAQKEIRIPLDENMSAIENAKKYYEKYAKLKRTRDALEEQVLKTSRELLHLQSILASLEIATEEEDLTQIKEELSDFSYIKRNTALAKPKHKSKPLHFLSSDGFHIYVGKNNYQNEELSFKFAEGRDWWFHVKNAAGSHVIVKSDGRELSDRCYEEAAALAAYYSSQRLSPKVEVDYLLCKGLKKVPGAAPGFVLYHSNWSILVSPDNKGLQLL